MKKQPKESVFGPDIPRTSRGHSCGCPTGLNFGPAEGAEKSRAEKLQADVSFPIRGKKLRKSQKTRQSTAQEVNGGQSWLSPPLLMAPKTL